MREGWERDGFVVLPGAAPAEAIAAYGREREAARDRLLVRAPGDEHPALATRAGDGPAGAIDPYAVSPAARALLLSEAVVHALTDLLGAAPLLLDAAETAAGAPDPGPYRDPTYVPVSEPAGLAGAVAALGDAAVVCFAGSQRLEPETFSGRYRHFNPERDGQAALTAHRERLAAALDGLERREVSLAAGDVLLWSADLVHEAPRGDALVAHLAPADAEPGWFAYRPERAGRVPFGRAWLASQHYDLEVPPPDAPLTAEPAGEHHGPVLESELEHVEEAIERHDAEQAGERPPAPGTRRGGGGLVDTVRGLMGRRSGR